jgi:hypothetical protein
VNALKVASKEAEERAEAKLQRKQTQELEASAAWTEYLASRQAEREKTERLRLLRLERDAAIAAAATTKPAKRSKSA